MTSCTALSDTSILFLVFNRPETTSKVFEAIRLARPARLYVAADGARSDRDGEEQRCAEVRRIATAVDWPCELRLLFRDRNLGCRQAVSSAITWFFENEPEGIILEDDCLPDPSFFPYCRALLERYRHDPRIMVITGNNYQETMQDYSASYYYSIYNHCWGWATWGRAWKLYDHDLSCFHPITAKHLLHQLSDEPEFERFWCDVLNRVKAGQIDTWDYQWTWSCWLHDGLTCTPSVNLVSNIGFGDNATHTKNPQSRLANLPTQPIGLTLTAPSEVRPAKRFDELVSRQNYRIKKASFRKRAVAELKSAMDYFSRPLMAG